MRGVEVETAQQGGGWMDGMGWDIRLMDHNTLHCTAILPLGLFFFFTYLSRRLIG